MNINQLVGNNSITLSLVDEQRVDDGYIYKWKADILEFRGNSLSRVAENRARIRSLGKAGIGRTVRTRAGNEMLMKRLTMVKNKEVTASYDYTTEIVYTVKVITG